MTSREIYSDADNLSLPVPSGLKSGDPVRVGELNGVLVTDRTPDTQTISDTQGPVTPGGNPPGYASVKLKGAREFDGVAFAVSNIGDPIYITPGNALSGSASGNQKYGAALSTKTATAGPLTVRIAN
jgi:hypothetical protein